MKESAEQGFTITEIPVKHSMGRFDNLFKKMDRQKYPFIDGLYYLFILVFLFILFLFFA